MAGRKDKNIVDYFPHYCTGGKTIYILESKFGNDGYAAWFKTLELLGATDNHFIDCRDDAMWEFMQAKIKVSSDLLIQIYSTLANLDAINKVLWENRVIWSGNFMKNIEVVYARRKTGLMTFDDLCKHLSIKCKHKLNTGDISDPGNAQSRVEYSKVNYIYGEFYDKEIELSCNDAHYTKFVKVLHGENKDEKKLAGVLSMPEQLTYKQFRACLEKAKKNNKSIQDILLSMENDKKYYKGKTSLNRTIQNWISDRFMKND